MKHTRKKLMSLLMALAIVCSMVPAAMASTTADTYVGVAVNGSTPLYANLEQTILTNAGYATLSYIEWSGGGNGISVSGNGYSATVTADATAQAGTSCTVTATGYYQLAGGSGYPGYPGYPGYQGIAGTRGQRFYVTVGGTSYGSTGSVGSGGYVSLSGSSTLAVGTSGTFSVTAGSGCTIQSVSWASSNPAVAAVSSYPYSSATVSALTPGVTTITATVSGYHSYYGAFTDYVGCYVTVTGTAGSGTSYGDLYMSASTLSLQPGSYGSTGNYGSLSVTSSAYSAYLTSPYLTWSSSNPSVAQVTSSSSGSSVYVYGVSAGQATITATLTDGTNTLGVASCLVTVGGSSSNIDILYTLTTGQSKTMDPTDFTTFWSEATNGGQLSYITFGTATGSVGRLVYTPSYYYNYGYSSTSQTSAYGSTFYVSPTTGQNAISAVSFVPGTGYSYGSTTTYATGSLTVPFTAYGTSDYYGTTTTKSGVLCISVTNGAVDTITYSAGSSVTLKPADFVDVYKKAVTTSSSYVTPTVYIQLLNAPAFGSLYYNYNNNSYYATPGTKLTSSNIGSMYFSSQTNSASGIEDLTYIPASTGASDTVRYAAYSTTGGTLLYVGEIKFTAASVADVEYYVTSGSTVTLDYTDFTSQTAFAAYPYITLSVPTSGKLYKDYANGKGTALSASQTFTLSRTASGSMSSLNTVTFVPGSTGVAKIPFTCSTYTGAQVSGTIMVYVTKKFPDVPAGDWSEEYIAKLAAKGIMSGNTDGTFGFKNDLKYGEALKLIMEAAGYNKQVPTDSKYWASGYIVKAYQDGLISSKDYTTLQEKKIDRNTVAAIAAKALKLNPTYTAASGIVKPTDSNDPYVLALYNAKIVGGSYENGKNVYKGSDTIKRSEIAKIICNVSDYYDLHN